MQCVNLSECFKAKTLELASCTYVISFLPVSSGKAKERSARRFYYHSLGKTSDKLSNISETLLTCKSDS